MTDGGLWYTLLGRLDARSLPFVRAWDHPVVSEIIGACAATIVVIGAIAVVWLLTWQRWWKPLVFDWLTSLDHKRIGIMYVVMSFTMLTRALIEAVLMRTQQAIAIDSPGIVAPDHFAQLFSTHGSIMIFFMAMPFLTGLINYAMPLQIGARDVAFPLLNSISLMLTIAGGSGLMMASLVVGAFSTGGWSGYPPYTELSYQPGRRTRLLDLGHHPVVHRFDPDGPQLRGDDLQEALSRHDADADASVLLERRSAPRS